MPTINGSLYENTFRTKKNTQRVSSASIQNLFYDDKYEVHFGM
jgi:hypothetical protein